VLKIHVLKPYDQNAVSRIGRLSAILGDRIEVVLFPDAADENWGIPTGVLMRAQAENALLFPTMLRDPGCGFLVFWLECEEFQEIKRDLCQRLADWAETFQDREAGMNCLLRLDLPFEADEKELIADGFGAIINTLEIRSVYDSSSKELVNGDLIGFIHGGCEGFVEVLERRFGLPAANYTLEKALFPDAAVEQGFFAFPYLSGQGQEYINWLKAGMELSIQARKCAFDALTNVISAFNAKVKLRYLWDRIHSGIEINGGEVVTFK